MCQVLGIENVGNVADRLDEDEKTYIRRTDVGLSPGRDLVYLAEQGLYTVLVRSDKPAAKPFRKWVCGDVLPCIRKHGCYPAPTAIVPVASPAREPMEVVRGFLETCTNILGLGGMDDRDRIILKDFARNRLLLDANCSAPNRRFHSIVDRAMTIGYPRLRSPHDSLCGRYVATAYRNKKNEEPTKHEQTVRGRTTMVNTYEDKDLDIIDQGIHAFFLDHPDLA